MANSPTGNFWLGIKSIAMTILFPGFVAGLIPFGFILQEDIPGVNLWTFAQFLAAAVVLFGLAILLRCVWEFAHHGQGTLAPFDEPVTLVIKGMYKHVRNPMYVGVYLILLGEAWFFWSSGIFIWTLVFILASNVVVIAFEEPRLRRKYGKDYEAYCKEVGRWIPGKFMPKDRLF